MKKLLFVFVLGAFAACGSNDNAEATTDSTSVTADTSSMMSTDTSSMMSTDTSTSTMGADTSAKSSRP